ncbi:transcription regulator HTH, apses-type DNA-binding domain-containing protein [Hyaloraphidium curvatum]|nr:transcription regulator HTH, apses-type DNA-binding domain-containing protein [Hyaloraphidium curvatum]
MRLHRPCGRCVRYKYPSCNDHVKFPTATAAAAPSSPGSSDPDAPPSKPFGALDPSQRPAVSEVREMNYSGTRVYEMVVTFPDIPPIGVMRRPGDSWINATHILQAARVDKGPRTRILTRDIQTGEHEKVLGGFGKHQGTWIPLRRAIELAKEYGVEELLKPLLIEDENQLQVRRGPVAGGDGDA